MNSVYRQEALGAEQAGEDKDLSVYVHIPFCARRCGYCDFNAYIGADAVIPAYVKALAIEAAAHPTRGRRVSTVFFGGGTPSYLSAAELSSILNEVRDLFQVDEGAEISLEVNPTSAEADKLSSLSRSGFNRVSIGVQSFNPETLRQLDRDHSPEEATATFRAARSAGFDSVSLDLIFGLPGQSLSEWAENISRAIDLGPDHLSVYGLTIEPGTRFERLASGGKLSLPGEDEQAEMFLLAEDKLEQAGLFRYEISNFARRGHECRHNLNYWHNGEYVGLGAGAAGYYQGERTRNEPHPVRYVDSVRISGRAIVERERLDEAGTLSETLMVGLRLVDGIPLDQLTDRFSFHLINMVQMEAHRWQELGLMEGDNRRLALTGKGRLVADSVVASLMAAARNGMGPRADLNR